LQSKIGSVGASDAFVAKFAPDGTLLWSTYLGGCCDDWATGVAVDAAAMCWSQDGHGLPISLSYAQLRRR
jgi:hypothetical protein